jgi:hypothetical protein
MSKNKKILLSKHTRCVIYSFFEFDEIFEKFARLCKSEREMLTLEEYNTICVRLCILIDAKAFTERSP